MRLLIVGGIKNFMILLRRGIKRLFALLCAALLILNLALYPFRARATAGALAAVGAAATVSAFLMACGIYPYVTEEGKSFGEWGAESLYDLWTQYVDSFEGGNLPSGGTAETFNQIKSFVVGNTLAIASGTWEMLRGFASWIVSKFALEDNLNSVQLGQSYSGKERLTYFSEYPSKDDLLESGTLLGKRAHITNFSQPESDDVEESIIAGSYVHPYTYSAFCYLTDYTVRPYAIVEISSSEYDSIPKDTAVENVVRAIGKGSPSKVTMWKNTFTSADDTYYYLSVSITGSYYLDRSTAIASGSHYYLPELNLPVYDTFDDFVRAVLGLVGTTDFAGIFADTTTVSPLEALPADTPWGGLSVQGTSNPAGTVEQGVIDREKPVVRPVEIEIGAGTDVDSETGEVTENLVVITPGDVVLPASDYQVPGLSSVFPFSLPWDIYRIYSALNTEPVRPEWDVTIYVPILEIQVPMHIGFPEDVAPAVDNFMSLARELILVLLCVLTLIGVRNLIR